ncbi:cytochrome P450 [Actinocorallia aurea]
MRIRVKEALLGTESVADPYPEYEKLRERAPVHRVVLRDGLACWAVTRYEEVRAALTDPRLSREPGRALAAWHEADRGRPLEDESDLGEHLLTTEAPVHTRLRRLVSDAFSVRRAAAARPRVQALADSLVDGFAHRGEADLIADFAYPLAIGVIGEILGIPERDGWIFRQWTSNAVRPGPADVPEPGPYLRALIAAKRREPGDDFISRLVAAEREGALTGVELASMIFLLLLAGHEGSVALVGNGVLALLLDDVQRGLLLRRPDLVVAAVEEVLRFDGPMELAAWRFATEPLTLGGVRIEAGDPVVLALAAAHRDPVRYPAPDRFDLTREDLTHLGFGYGAHYCVGAPLARVEGAVALETLFRRLPDLALTRPAADLPRQASQIIRGLRELPVRFTPG